MFSYILGILAGVAQTTQTSVNTKLSDKIKSTYLASIFSFGSATIFTAIIVMVMDGGINLPLSTIAQEPFWIWGGGLCGVGIVVLNILCLPKLGSALTVMLLSFGQIMTGLIIDNWGLFESVQNPMTISKTIGAIVFIAGIALVSFAPEKGTGQSRSPIYMLLAIIAGTFCSLQVAINGRLSTVVGHSWKCTLISMTIGTLGCIILALGLFLTKGKQAVFNIQSVDMKLKWYMLTGGIFAVIIVGSNAITAPLIGTGIVTVMNLIGQMGAGLIIDAVGFLGIEKKPITRNKVIGMLLMIAGTVVIMLI